MHILVTGLRGFTGQYLSVELEKSGHVVSGLSSNLLNYEALASEIDCIHPDAVIHLAAISFVGYKNSEDFYKINVLGTHYLLKALAKYASKLKSVMLASSASIYGSSTELLDESTAPNPQNDYAVSKLSMEYMAKLWMEKLPIFIVRPFNYTGIGQNENFLIPKIVSHFIQKKSIIELGNLDVCREFCDVRVIVEIYRKLIEYAPTGKIINVCMGQLYSLHEVIQIAKNISHHEIKIKINPAYIRDNDSRVLQGDNRRLKELIGIWTEIPFSETMQWMLRIL